MISTYMTNVNVQLEKYDVRILVTQLDKLGSYGNTRTTPTHTAHLTHTHGTLDTHTDHT